MKIIFKFDMEGDKLVIRRRAHKVPEDYKGVEQITDIMNAVAQLVTTTSKIRGGEDVSDDDITSAIGIAVLITRIIVLRGERIRRISLRSLEGQR